MEATISGVTLTEIFYKHLQEKRPYLAEKRTTNLRHTIYLKKLDIGEEVAVKTGAFKGKYKVPIADASIAAVAYFQRLTMISGNPDLKNNRS